MLSMSTMAPTTSLLLNTPDRPLPPVAAESRQEEVGGGTDPRKVPRQDSSKFSLVI